MGPLPISRSTRPHCEEFYNESKDRTSLPKKINEFNRLVAHSKSFFIISGYGAFTPGYLLIISKDFLPAFGLVDESQLSELNFIIKVVKESIDEELNRNSVVFEHGMCACIGGLDRLEEGLFLPGTLSNNFNPGRETIIKAITKNAHKVAKNVLI